MSQLPIVLVLDLVLTRAASAAGRRWPPWSLEGLADAFAAAPRRLGRSVVELTTDEAEQLRTAGLCHNTWEADELGRIAILAWAARELDEEGLAAFAEDCYRRGDTRERVAVLRALALLPPSDRTVEIGVDACRSSVQPIFEAIACENPFPARRFPELNFNQMVLKALFTDVRLARIVGLDGRVTADLRRMAVAYASERRAAGRSVPIDIDRLTDHTPFEARPGSAGT
jgi:hypothetical protein